MPWARSPVRVAGPTACGWNRLSCQMILAKKSSGKALARAAASTIRQSDSPESVDEVVCCGPEPAPCARQSQVVPNRSKAERRRIRIRPAKTRHGRSTTRERHVQGLMPYPFPSRPADDASVDSACEDTRLERHETQR